VAVRIVTDCSFTVCYCRTLAHFGHDAQRIEGLTGVWVNGAKLAAVGVKVCNALDCTCQQLTQYEQH
jgi:lipoate-protein ligase B